MRVVDPEDPDAALDTSRATTSRSASQSAAPVVGVEVDVVDVLVALRRVLGVLDRAVGAAVEPLRMLAQPRVVGRALDREVERELDARRSRPRATRASKSPSVPSSGCTASWPPSSAPIAHGLPGSPRPASSALFRPLRFVTPDRVDRRQVDDVEAELGQLRQHLGDAAEAAPRTREQLVPGAEARPLAFDVDLERLPE